MAQSSRISYSVKAMKQTRSPTPWSRILCQAYIRERLHGSSWYVPRRGRRGTWCFGVRVRCTYRMCMCVDRRVACRTLHVDGFGASRIGSCVACGPSVASRLPPLPARTLVRVDSLFFSRRSCCRPSFDVMCWPPRHACKSYRFAIVSDARVKRDVQGARGVAGNTLTLAPHSPAFKPPVACQSFNLKTAVSP